MSFLSTNGEQSESYLGIGVVAFIGIAFFAIIGLLGPSFNFGGYNGAVAALDVGDLFLMLYAFAPGFQRYTVGIGMVILGGVIGVAIENFIPFGALQVAALNSGIFAGQIAGGMMVLLAIVALVFGAYYIKVDDI